METKTNLLIGQFVTTRIGLIFIYTTVVGLGFALIAAGSLAFVSRSERLAKLEAAKQAHRASSVTEAVSNEKANPGTIGVYLADTFAGALTDDGIYSPAAEAPPEGPLALFFINPTDTPLPTIAEFPAQRITLTTNTGTLTACTPKITAEATLWVSKNGSTFYDNFLTQPARNC